MPRSLHIVQGDKRRVAGRKGPAKLQPGLVRCRRITAWVYHPNTEHSNQYKEPGASRRVTISRRFNKTTHHRVTANEELVC